MWTDAALERTVSALGDTPRDRWIAGIEGGTPEGRRLVKSSKENEIDGGMPDQRSGARIRAGPRVAGGILAGGSDVGYTILH